MTITDTFPTLASELFKLLPQHCHAALAERVSNARIVRVTFDASVNAGYIYVEPTQQLNPAEEKLVVVRHAECVPIQGKYDAVVDVDNFGRPMGVEILMPGDLKDLLNKFAKYSHFTNS